MLRPVFVYILCNPILDSLDCCAQPAWQLLIESKHSICLQTEVLLWLCTTDTCVCINTNYRVLELAKKAMLEKDKGYYTALLPVIIYLTIQLLKQGSIDREEKTENLLKKSIRSKALGSIRFDWTLSPNYISTALFWYIFFFILAE